jgi:hypothetical protein
VEELRSRPIDDKQVARIHEIILPKAIGVTAMFQADQNREREDLSHTTNRIVLTKQGHPKHDLTINWKFLLLLAATLLGLVSAGDCAVLNLWKPANFSATGTECCIHDGYTGIKCVGESITEM